jgi:hypothetical protein
MTAFLLRLTLLTCALRATTSSGLLRGLQPTLDDYSMEFVDAINEKNQMNVKFKNGPGDGSLNGRFEIFVADSTSASSDKINHSCYSDGGKLYTAPGISNFASSIGTPESTFSFAFDENVNKGLPFYHVTSNGEVKFQVCVKFTLSKMISDMSTDIIFREVAISVDVRLDGSIGSSHQADESPTKAMDQIAQNEAVSTQRLQIRAGVCDGYDDVAPENTLVPLCIYSMNSNTYIVSLQDVELVSGSWTQRLVQDRIPLVSTKALSSTAIASSEATAENEISCPESSCVRMDIEASRFFPSAYGSVVSLKGMAILLVGNERRSVRALVTQEIQDDTLKREVHQSFETSFDLSMLAALQTRDSKITASLTSPVSAAGWVGITRFSLVLTAAAGLALVTL